VSNTALPRCAECVRRCRPRDELYEGDSVNDHAGTHRLVSKYLSSMSTDYICLPVHRELAHPLPSVFEAP
jgi:hypothetical protein